MTAIIEWFESVSSAISSFIAFLGDMIADLLGVVEMLGQAALAIPKLFTILPPVVTVSFGSILAIAVIYKILGREG